MQNKIRIGANMENDFYNPDIKISFLSCYPESTQNTYKYIFKRSAGLERFYRKDLYDFDRVELSRFFAGCEEEYVSSARSNGRIVTAYIDWAINNQIKMDSVNVLKQVDTKWFDRFVNDNAKIFYTKKEIQNIINKCENPQDAVIISLIFDGVQGKAVSEVRNLKESDVDFETGLVNLIDEDGSKRSIKVTDLTLHLIEQAYEEPYYYKSNGMMVEKDNVRNYTELLNNEYIVRSSNTGKRKNLGPVDKYVVYRRISSIGNSLGLENFNIKNISRSGMLSLAKEMMEVYKENINLPMLLKISDIYNVNSYNSLRDFITEENIFDLYGFRIKG